jgi:hypothetical protein
LLFSPALRALYGEETFLALANSLQFSASGWGKFAAARGIRLQHAGSDVYRAKI